MASYRPDNRKLYPLRRVRLRGARRRSEMAAGQDRRHPRRAVWLSGAPARSGNPRGQLREDLRPDCERCDCAWGRRHRTLPIIHTSGRHEATRGFSAAGRPLPTVSICSGAQRSIGPHLNPLAVYFPYSDWIVERWTASILPALDAFRRAHSSLTSSYAPPIEESVCSLLPALHEPPCSSACCRHGGCWFCRTSQVSADRQRSHRRLRQARRCRCVRPADPKGRSFERDRLFGGREVGGLTPRGVRVSTGFGRRVSPDGPCTLPAPGQPAWLATTTGRVLATFDDGSPAILANAHVRGWRSPFCHRRG